ncbi:FAD-binding oxidoreductase [Actinoallomurus rhizosphaericola]|uniref:FAD-binding oxidoreductase n=1 Tax=Actinoallomurus rhizosphaericola TaxID=2952536 RepID=UPI0020915EED|nr:FAD-binding oxidoreductase [Actinoallomurus rhizosphaericola]MCO5993427.1 FAD-binding oxidoreductase [Actinoallomurus rhizosphaericola]
MRWNGWGDPDRAAPLPDSVVGLLRELLGVRPDPVPPVPLAEVAPPAPAPVVRALTEIVGPDAVLTDDEARIRHTRGKSTPDLLRIRAGDAGAAPDAVVLPAGHEEVLAVLDRCSRERVAVVPFGGGTSVVGGLAAAGEGFAGVVALDLRRLDRVTALDTVARTATLQAGLRAPRAEALLAERGFTLGHYPQSYEWATIGGFAATRSSGQASAGYGRFDEMVAGLTVATPRGTLTLGRAPKSAAGPDLRELVLGSEGAFGVITDVTVRIRPLPEQRRYEGWRFPTFAEGTAAVRALAQDGPMPTVLRLSDETETMIGLARPGEIGGTHGGGCLAVCGYEGGPDDVAARRAGAHAALTAHGGEPLGDAPGESWAAGRYSAPYLRDALLDVGAFAETLETAGFWSALPRLADAVRQTLSRELPSSLVMCHISHVYRDGASLYFTVVTAQGDDPVGRWRRAKAAVSDAIVEAGGTITHHHGVGTDHRAWLAREIGPLGVDVLRAVKDRLDPAGILNPGVLIPPAGG